MLPQLAEKWLSGRPGTRELDAKGRGRDFMPDRKFVFDEVSFIVTTPRHLPVKSWTGVGDGKHAAVHQSSLFSSV
jgi:hypothetical protein